MKKCKIAIISLSLLLALSVASCNNTQTPSSGNTTTVAPSATTTVPTLPTTTTNVNPGAAYYDNPADPKKPYDHYFSNKLTLADLNPTISRDEKGKLSGNFIADGIAKLTLKSITDGDTAVFKLNNNEKDSYTVRGKSYDTVTIRFTGIDTPESTSSIDPWGKAASNYCKELLKNAEGIIVDALDVKQDNEIERNYSNRVDSNGTRWLGLIWYCPKGKDSNELSNYRSYQLDMIEECYTESVHFNSTRYAYNASKSKEPLLYSRYESVTDSISGEVTKRYGSLTLSELFFEAGNRMAKTGTKLRAQGEIDEHYDYSKTPTKLTITEAISQIDTLMSRGTYVEVTGVITRYIGSNFYLQDKSGTPLYIYMGINGNSISDIYNVGDTIKIRGRLCEYGGQYQMSDVIYKASTFGYADEADKVDMPDPIDINDMSFSEIKQNLGKLVTYNITIGNIGSYDKNNNYSLTNNNVMKDFQLAYVNKEKKVEFYTTEEYNALTSEQKSNLEAVKMDYDPNKLQVRVNGTLAPTYSKDGFVEGKTYKVTGILSIYANEDYTVPFSYPSYQIVVGNRNLNGTIVNEIEEVK